MLKLLVVFATSMSLAFISEKNTKAILESGQRYTVWRDWAYLLMVVILFLFSGLRTSYNDTGNYISGFKGVPSLSEYLSSEVEFNLFKNPLFFLYESFLKSCNADAQVLIFSTSMFCQTCLVLFLKRYSSNFTFSIFLYFTLGTFVFSMAAMKQVTAMAILTLAFPCLEEKRWIRYYLIVLIAMLVHTYAMAFAVLPFFRVKPWHLFTVLFITLTALIVWNFETAITEFMEQANDLGKTLSENEVFGDVTINVFRLAVYAIPPLISLLFRKWVVDGNTPIENVLIQMSIISLCFMSMGTQAGANMFGRMANYFELGTICCLPAMLKKTFEKKSYYMIMTIACVCFIGFFVYANAINLSFGQQYKAISFGEFLLSFF